MRESKGGGRQQPRLFPEHLANELALLPGLSTAERTELASRLRKWLTLLEENAEGSQLYLGMTLLHSRVSLMRNCFNRGLGFRVPGLGLLQDGDVGVGVEQRVIEPSPRISASSAGQYHSSAGTRQAVRSGL